MDDNLKALIRSTGVSPRHINAKLKDFDFKVDLNSENGIFITGPVGTGKTHLASAITKNFIRQHLKEAKGFIEPPRLPVLISYPELLFDIKKTYDVNNTQTEEQVLSKYLNCPVLALDDIGSEKISEWSIQLLSFLINWRYLKMKKTFISSNLSLKEISEQLDDRIASRINQMCDVLKLTGKDKRVK